MSMRARAGETGAQLDEKARVFNAKYPMEARQASLERYSQMESSERTVKALQDGHEESEDREYWAGCG